ncbi:MAG TPA: hypothetical protein VIV60_35785 [Polyangiaceae bacterium]
MDASPNNAPPLWAVGAGLSANFVTYSGANALYASNLGMLSGSGASPLISPLAFLEYRLDTALRVFVQPEFYYSQNKFENETKSRYSGGYSVGVGLRWIANPKGLVEVGMAHMLYVASSSYRAPTTLIPTNSGVAQSAWATPTTETFGTATALVAERMLLPRLWLRVAATMFRAYLAKTTVTEEVENRESNSSHSNSASIRFGFEPSLSLRLAF